MLPQEGPRLGGRAAYFLLSLLRFHCIPLYSRREYSLIVWLPTLTSSPKHEYYVQITPQEVAHPFWVTLSYLPAVYLNPMLSQGYLTRPFSSLRLPRQLTSPYTCSNFFVNFLSIFEALCPIILV